MTYIRDYFVKSNKVDKIAEVANDIVIILDEINRINFCDEDLDVRLTNIVHDLKSKKVPKPRTFEEEILNRVIDESIESFGDNKHIVIQKMKYDRFTDIINIFENGSKNCEISYM